MKKRELVQLSTLIGFALLGCFVPPVMYYFYQYFLLWEFIVFIVGSIMIKVLYKFYFKEKSSFVPYLSLFLGIIAQFIHLHLFS